ncbi:PREDICTED: uncharacterized protein LOC105458932 isoform X2 [Wasmannia auropunctata]|uniref:uncharacterized protein LOC105458932 isoform X2 n=1 Tax=Wasmannia auropunctata TaxID=64793 RepID=UPI0005EECFD2|nr:PREDICTED: uncharacterized protein LOC105458932 isoform X2 [Wasmannia auropunctata]
MHIFDTAPIYAASVKKKTQKTSTQFYRSKQNGKYARSVSVTHGPSKDENAVFKVSQWRFVNSLMTKFRCIRLAKPRHTRPLARITLFRNAMQIRDEHLDKGKRM